MKTATAKLDRGQVVICADYAQAPLWKAIPGRRWDPYARVWVLPFNEETVSALRSVQPVALDEALKAVVSPLDKPRPQTDNSQALRDDMPVKGAAPFKHQKEAYAEALAHQSFAILHEPGLGKTLTAIAVMGRRYLDGQISRALVVAPLSVVPVWGREIAQYADFPVYVLTLAGTAKQKTAALAQTGNNGLTVAVINYESARVLEDDLRAWRPDMIVLDESQRIKNHSAQQSKTFHRLGQKAQYRMILTGTPVCNSPLDIWSQFRFLQPDILEPSYYAFRNHYSVMGGYENKQVVAYKHLDELTAKVYGAAHRARKADALDLPPYIDQTRYCVLEPAARRIYSKLKRDAVAELEHGGQITAPKVITQMLRLSQLTGGFARADGENAETPVSTAKLKLFSEVLEELLEDPDRKVVVFARFLAELTAIAETAEAAVGKDGYRMIRGDVPAADRGKVVSEFQTDPAVRVFIAQTRTAGLGITLHAADTAIFYSLDYSYADYEQARDRIHRAGQTRPCTAIHLIAEDTIDETVAGALREKKDIAAYVVDNWKEAMRK